MPYINNDMKQTSCVSEPDSTLEESVNAVINHIRSHTSSDRDGMCNYAISRIVAGSLKPSTGWKYKNLNRAYGTFLSAASEFYRRVVSKYEDRCIARNGDIPEFMD